MSITQQGNQKISTPMKNRKLAELILEFDNSERRLRDQVDRYDKLLLDLDNVNYNSNLNTQIKEEQRLFKQFKHIYKCLDEKGQQLYLKRVVSLQKVCLQHVQLFKMRHQNIKQYEKYINQKIYLNKRINQAQWVFIIRGLLGILGAFCLHLLIGAIYRWPMINVYATSYYKITNDPQLTNNENSVGTPIFMLSVGITMKLGLKLSKIIGKMPLLISSVIMLVVSIYLSHLMPSFILFIIFHNFLYGMFAGLMFLTTLSECQKYFPEWALLINSFILVGTGLGGVLFGSMNTRCMNPHLFIPNGSGYFSNKLDSIAYSLPNCIESMTYSVGGIGVLGCVLIWRLCRFNDAAQATNQQIKWPTYFQFSCYDESQALQSGVFWKIIGIVVLCSEGNFFMAMNYSKICSPQITEQAFLQYVVMANGVANGIFRFIWGNFLRKFGFKYTFLIVMSINIICFATIAWTVFAPQLYLFSFFVSGACLGGLMVMIPNICLLVFGQKIGNQMYSYYWAAFTFANFIQYLMGVSLSHGYEYVDQFKVFLVLGVLGLTLGLTTKYQGRWQNSLDKLTF